MGESSQPAFQYINMKYTRLIMFVFFIGLTKLSSGQEKVITNYLLLRIDVLVDVNGKDYYYAIKAEQGCKEADKIYALKKYDNKKNALNNECSFYYKEKDTLNNLYNYFLSPTEVLNFLSSSKRNETFPSNFPIKIMLFMASFFVVGVVTGAKLVFILTYFIL